MSYLVELFLHVLPCRAVSPCLTLESYFSMSYLVELFLHVFEPLTESLDVSLEAFHLQVAPPFQILVALVHQFESFRHLVRASLQCHERVVWLVREHAH